MSSLRSGAVPRAIADGRRRAAALAAAAGLPLRALTAISDAAPVSPFVFPGQFGESGTFGPGRYCGQVRSVVFRTDANGTRRRVAGKSHRACRIPAQVASNLTMVFASG